MSAGLPYPDLDPPPGWVITRAGTQIRLTPPGTTLQTADVTIIVSPLIGRSERVPPIDRLIEYAIAAEAKARLEVTEQTGPTPAVAHSGLEGVSYTVTGYARPAAPVEKRIYVMYADERGYYGINYMASQAAYDEHLDTFWRVARSIRPVAAAAPPAG